MVDEEEPIRNLHPRLLWLCGMEAGFRICRPLYAGFSGTTLKGFEKAGSIRKGMVSREVLANPEQFDSASVVDMLKRFRLALSKAADEPHVADSIGTTLEKDLQERFESGRSNSRFAETKGHGTERKQIDRTFLMVRGANQAMADGRVDLAAAFVDTALALWSKVPAARRVD